MAAPKPPTTTTTTTTVPAPTTQDAFGFKFWSFDTKFDPVYPVWGQIVQVPAALVPAGKQAFYAQVAKNDTTYAFRWSEKQWFDSYDKANAWLQNEVKKVALEKLYA